MNRINKPKSSLLFNGTWTVAVMYFLISGPCEPKASGLIFYPNQKLGFCDTQEKGPIFVLLPVRPTFLLAPYGKSETGKRRRFKIRSHCWLWQVIECRLWRREYRHHQDQKGYQGRDPHTVSTSCNLRANRTALIQPHFTLLQHFTGSQTLVNTISSTIFTNFWGVRSVSRLDVSLFSVRPCLWLPCPSRRNMPSVQDCCYHASRTLLEKTYWVCFPGRMTLTESDSFVKGVNSPFESIFHWR